MANEHDGENRIYSGPALRRANSNLGAQLSREQKERSLRLVVARTGEWIRGFFPSGSEDRSKERGLRHETGVRGYEWMGKRYERNADSGQS